MPNQNRIVVSNATPIISLAILQKVDLLEKLYGEVFVPMAVKNELFAGGNRAGANAVGNADYLKITSLKDSTKADLLSDLDRGEAETIALALELKADLVIIDERLGRRHTQRLGLTITGVLGVLLKAKSKGYLGQIKPEIEALKSAGIHLGERLVKQVLILADEANG